MGSRTVITLFVAAAIAPAVLAAGEKSNPKPTREAKAANTARFEALKKLAGDWTPVGKDGKPAGEIISSFRVTAGGTAVQETVFPGTDHEMLTVYHLDDGELVLTHYCTMGNQPQMRAVPEKDPNKVVFKFVGGGNIKPGRSAYMHKATITIVDNDHYRAEWTACKDGKDDHKGVFDVVRKR